MTRIRLTLLGAAILFLLPILGASGLPARSLAGF